jgi:endonuclease/exonuclease/phosphatase family metal-dependent hydrolase
MGKPFFRRLTKKILLFSNLLLGLIFIAGINVKHFDPENWWFLSLITLVLPYLLLALLIFLFFWLFVKPFYIFISLATLLLSYDAVENIFQLNFSSAFSLEKKPGDIRVMSWNVEQFDILQHKAHPEVKQKMFDLINKYDPDIACFQEAVIGENKKSINYFPDIKKALKFTDNLYSYTLKDDFDQNHHFGIIIFSKYPIVRKQMIVNNPNNYNSTYQFIDVLVNKDTFRIFNVHLQSLKFSKENREYLDKPSRPVVADISESKSIISKIKKGIIKRASQAFFIKDEMKTSPYPIILCGDFNDVPVSYAYETIGKGMNNAFVQKGSGISGTFSSISPTLRIDNIFVDKRFSVSQFIRVKKKLSDHFPIIADLKFTPKEH